MPFFQDPPLHDFPDRAIRLLQAYPAHLRELVQEVAPNLAPRLDFERAEALHHKFPLPDWRHRESDLLFHVPFLPGQGEAGVLICLLVEHQSQADPAMPLRTLWYAVLYWEQQWRTWEQQHPRGQPLRLTPVLPIVLHTGQGPWDTNRRLLDLMAGPVELHGLVPSWQPIFWDLAERSPQQLLQLMGEWLPTLAVVRGEKEDAAEFQALYAEVLRRLEPLGQRDETRWKDLVWFVLSWGLRRRPRAEQNNLYAAALQTHQQVAVRKEVETMKQMLEKTWEQEMLERGEARGEARGEVRGVRATLLRQGRKRFGQPDDATLAALEAIADLNRLAQLSERLLDVSSWQDLLAGGGKVPG